MSPQAYPLVFPWPRLRPSNLEDKALSTMEREIWWSFHWQGQKVVYLHVPTLNLFRMPFAFCSKIQNHKLCTARKLKGQALSGVHFESEVQNTFNDIITKIYPSENFSLNKECILRQWHSVSLSVATAPGAGGGGEGKPHWPWKGQIC